MGLGPDQSDDIRGGMTLRGVLNLQKFVEDGGLFIPITNCTRVAVDYGLVSGVAIQEPRTLQARGSVYNATFSDRRSPICLRLCRDFADLFQSGAPFPGGRRWWPRRRRWWGEGGGGGGAGGRPSGRGTLTDPDIVQGMPLAEPAAQRRPGGGEQLTDEQRLQQGPFFTPPGLRPRVVLRFVSDEKNLLISGMLAGGSELANAPAIVDVPVGQGHVVMFANNPMWRHQTQGSFFLIFNAALNYDHLGAGRDRPAGQANEATRSGDNN